MITSIERMPGAKAAGNADQISVVIDGSRIVEAYTKTPIAA
jgi:hypothetical protein